MFWLICISRCFVHIIFLFFVFFSKKQLIFCPLCIIELFFYFFILQLYVPDEDKPIFGRTLNKQVFEGLTTCLLQTIATILESLWLHLLELGQEENTRISSLEDKVKLTNESFNNRTQDLIRYFPPPTAATLSLLLSTAMWVFSFPDLLPSPVHPSSTPVPWVESLFTSGFLNAVSRVKNWLTKCQVCWTRSNWCLRMRGGEC